MKKHWEVLKATFAMIEINSAIISAYNNLCVHGCQSLTRLGKNMDCKAADVCHIFHYKLHHLYDHLFPCNDSQIHMSVLCAAVLVLDLVAEKMLSL